MATKPGRMVTYNKELPSIKARPFYLVGEFNFSYRIYKVRTQTPKSSVTSCSSVSIVNFEHVIAGWVLTISLEC